jgi:hypothetical protein
VTTVEWCDLPTVLERWAGLKGGIHPAVREYLEQSLATNDADNSSTALPLA